MKRSGFKNKPRKPLKRSYFARKMPSSTLCTKDTENVSEVPKIKRKRKKKTERQLAEEELWQLCREIVKKLHGNTCYTSGQANLEGVNAQCGHGKPKAALPLKYKYDLRNLRPQSFYANINLGGMSDIFIAKLEREEEGLEFLEEVCVKIDGRWEIKHVEPFGSTEALLFIKNKIEEYKELLNNL